MGICMMMLLAGCGGDRPEGLKLVIVQEHPLAGNSTATIIDYDEDPPKRIDLRVGEPEQGIELIEVNFETRAALIRRDGEEIRLTMSEGEPDGTVNEEPTPQGD